MVDVKQKMMDWWRPVCCTTAGDMGHVDDVGHLYLSDRKVFTIVSGRVDIYRQEIENALTLHPAVDDVAEGLPRGAAGKLLKGELRRKYLEKTWGAAEPNAMLEKGAPS